MKNGWNSRNIKVLSLLEARDRSNGASFLPDDGARSDCWPDWSIREDDSATVERRARDNSPGKFLSEVALAITIPLALAVIVSLLVPAP